MKGSRGFGEVLWASLQSWDAHSEVGLDAGFGGECLLLDCYNLVVMSCLVA
jgi:hypothetical protein